MFRLSSCCSNWARPCMRDGTNSGIHGCGTNLWGGVVCSRLLSPQVLAEGAVPKQTPLVCAVQAACGASVAALLAHGVDVNQATVRAWARLMFIHAAPPPPPPVVCLLPPCAFVWRTHSGAWLSRHTGRWNHCTGRRDAAWTRQDLFTVCPKWTAEPKPGEICCASRCVTPCACLHRWDWCLVLVLGVGVGVGAWCWCWCWCLVLVLVLVPAALVTNARVVLFCVSRHSLSHATR